MPGNAFLAVPLGTDKRHELSAALSAASPGSPVPGKRVHPENWHLTVRFLGDFEDVVIDRVAAAIDEHLDVDRGTATAFGLGAFPKATKAGIVYVAVDDDGSLNAVAARCEELVREVGVAPEERPFVPHITLSRLRPRMDVARLIGRFEPFAVRFPVESVVLYRTTKSPDGVRYRPLHTFSLR